MRDPYIGQMRTGNGNLKHAPKHLYCILSFLLLPGQCCWAGFGGCGMRARDYARLATACMHWGGGKHAMPCMGV